MPDSRAAEPSALNPALSRLHLLVLLPFVGLFLVWRARGRATDEADRSELTSAVRCQMGGASVWALHLVLQAAIGGVWWLVTETPGGKDLVEVTKVVVVAATVLNLFMWLLEWGVVVAAGVRASRGRRYPLSRRDRRSASASARAESRAWKPLNAEAAEPRAHAPDEAGSRADLDDDG